MQIDQQLANWRWRLENLYHIVDDDGFKVPFRPRPVQRQFLDDLWYRNVVLKSRQHGFSTIIDLFGLDHALFNANVAFGIIADTRENAERLFQTKVKYPYDTLAPELKDLSQAEQFSARALRFSNGSTIEVGTSLRSGTFQVLHISEYGKTCAQRPDKAREIRTGALNTVPNNGIVTIESTAEGEDGSFYEMCEVAKALDSRGADLTPLDYKFHFYPWHVKPANRLDAGAVAITKECLAYFDDLEHKHSIKLDDDQKAWYFKTLGIQREDMLREHPSTPDEAFKASVEGAIYGEEMAAMEAEGRICPLPIERCATETWWDLGQNDLNAIIWVQRVGPWIHFIDYHENHNRGMRFYADQLTETQAELKLSYSRHIWPHDGGNQIFDEEGRHKTDVMAGLGYVPTVSRRTRNRLDGIHAVRAYLPRVRIDSVRCDKLVRRLRNYRWKRDEVNGRWLREPLHNDSSNGADAVRTGVEYKPSLRPKSARTSAAPQLAIV